MNNKFLFIEKKKVITISVVVSILIISLIAIFINTQSTDKIEKIASKEQIRAQEEDVTAPTIQFSTQGNDKWEETGEVQVIVTDNENGTGIDKDSLKYLWVPVSRTDAISEEEFTNTFENEEYIPFPSNIEGEYYLCVIAKDIAGNLAGTRTELSFKIDTKAPEVTFYQNEGNIIMKIMDLGSGIRTDGETMFIWEDGELKCNFNMKVNDNNITEPSYQATEITDGDKVIEVDVEIFIIDNYQYGDEIQLTVNLEDECNNSTGDVSINYILEDGTAPTIAFEPNGIEEWINNEDICVTVIDEESGVDENSLKYKWVLANSTTEPLEEEFTSAFINGRSISLPENVEGEYKLWILAKDNSENTIIEASNIVKVDTKAPQAQFSKQVSNVETDDVITVTITDEGSGIFGIENMSSTHYAWLPADTSNYEQAWNNATITKINNGYKFNVIVPSELELNQKYIIVLSAAEDVVDNLGQEVEPRISPEYTYVDLKKPTMPRITIVSGTQNEKLEYTTDVVVEIAQGTDDGIGIDRTILKVQYTDEVETTDYIEVITEETKQFTFNNNGTYKLTAMTYDKAGNVAQTNEYQIKIDKEIQDVTKVTLNKEEVTLLVGERERLIATVLPNNATNKKVIWESSDETILEIDQNGYIKALKPGTVTITVTTEDGGFTDVCNITVKEKAEKYFLSDKYYILNEDKIIVNISPETTLTKFKDVIDTNMEYKIVSKDDVEIKETEIIATGMKIILEDNTEYSIVVKGDINGDGEANLTDLAKIKKHIIQMTKLESLTQEAADINMDGEVNLTDLAKLVKYIIKLIEI